MEKLEKDVEYGGRGGDTSVEAAGEKDEDTPMFGGRGRPDFRKMQRRWTSPRSTPGGRTPEPDPDQ